MDCANRHGSIRSALRSIIAGAQTWQCWVGLRSQRTFSRSRNQAIDLLGAALRPRLGRGSLFAPRSASAPRADPRPREPSHSTERRRTRMDSRKRRRRRRSRCPPATRSSLSESEQWSEVAYGGNGQTYHQHTAKLRAPLALRYCPTTALLTQQRGSGVNNANSR